MAHMPATSLGTIWMRESCRQARLREDDGIISANTTTEAELIYCPDLLRLSVLGANKLSASRNRVSQ
jgi:hypothetical protein